MNIIDSSQNNLKFQRQLYLGMLLGFTRGHMIIINIYGLCGVSVILIYVINILSLGKHIIECIWNV